MNALSVASTPCTGRAPNRLARKSEPRQLGDRGAGIHAVIRLVARPNAPPGVCEGGVDLLGRLLFASGCQGHRLSHLIWQARLSGLQAATSLPVSTALL